MNMVPWRLIGGILVLLALLIGPAGAGTIYDDFSNPNYSATLWTVNTTTGETAKVEDGVLKLSLDSDSGSGNWASFDNKFTVSGDFVLTFDYNLVTLSNARAGISFGWSGNRWCNEHRFGGGNLDG